MVGDKLTHMGLQCVDDYLGNHKERDQVRWRVGLHIRGNLPRQRIRRIILAFRPAKLGLGYDVSGNRPRSDRLDAHTSQ